MSPRPGQLDPFEGLDAQPADPFEGLDAQPAELEGEPIDISPPRQVRPPTRQEVDEAWRAGARQPAGSQETRGNVGHQSYGLGDLAGDAAQYAGDFVDRTFRPGQVTEYQRP